MSLGTLANVTVVVPVGRGDSSWQSLALDLAALDGRFETVFVAAEDRPPSFESHPAIVRLAPNIQWIRTNPGRAHQMNLGAAYATRPVLWYLHADTRIEPAAVAALQVALDRNVDAIHYFDLEFASDGPRLAQLNAYGVRFRSRCLRLPFGDQGLCLSRKSFAELGGFPENVTYGEDHLLIWAAHRKGVPVLPAGATIITSARKYATEGWIATTGLHALRTWRQAIPEFSRFVWSLWQ